MFYDKFARLCAAKGVSRTKACIDCGVSRTAWHKWEGGAIPNGTTINKFAAYFGVPVGQLLGEEIEKTPTPEGERSVGDIIDEVDIAFYGNYRELDNNDKETIRAMVQVMRERRAKKQE